jgi:hypothetical protein
VAYLAEAGKLLGALGASKGGHARAEKLSSEELSSIARKAVNTRWRREAEKVRNEEAGKYRTFEKEKRASIVGDEGPKRARITMTNNI